MRDRTLGRTTIDIVASIGVVALLFVVVVGIMGPERAVQKERDEMRVDGVRNIMEAFLELQTVDPEAMDRLRDAVEASGAPPRVMIGAGESCAGDWGVQCGDAILADGCTDLRGFLEDYLSPLPVDPDDGYSSEVSGYYVTFAPGVLEVGACNPEVQDTIRLERTFF